MSVPLVLIMVSNHHPPWFSSSTGWLVLAVLVALGWGGTKLMYSKAAGTAPATCT